MPTTKKQSTARSKTRKKPTTKLKPKPKVKAKPKSKPTAKISAKAPARRAMPSHPRTPMARSNERLLEALVEASQLLNSTLELRKVLAILLDLATKHLHAERGTIYLVDHKSKELWSQVVKGEKTMEIRLPLGKGIAGTVGKSGQVVNLDDVYADKRFDRSFDIKSGFRTRTMLCMPMRDKKRKIIGVFQILNKKRATFDEWDQRFLEALSIPASIAIENARLHEAEITNERVAKELEVAARIQRQLLPAKLPQRDGIEITAVTIPCLTVGGDFYDVIALDDDRLMFVIADVSGKGIPAALLVSTFHAALHSSLDRNLSSAELVTKLNDFIYKNTTSEKFITVLIAIWDRRTTTFKYVNAGHNYPYVIRTSGEIIPLITGGYCVGMLPIVNYQEGEIPMAPGDYLILYTDGVTESMNTKEELYGDERLQEVFTKQSGASLSALSDKIIEDIRTFSIGMPVADDITMVLAKVV